MDNPNDYIDRYRILQIETFDRTKLYKVQKRFLGFLWWYNFANDDLYETGIYDTLEQADEKIQRDMYKNKITIVKTYK